MNSKIFYNPQKRLHLMVERLKRIAPHDRSSLLFTVIGKPARSTLSGTLRETRMIRARSSSGQAQSYTISTRYGIACF